MDQESIHIPTLLPRSGRPPAVREVASQAQGFVDEKAHSVSCLQNGGTHLHVTHSVTHVSFTNTPDSPAQKKHLQSVVSAQMAPIPKFGG